MKTETSSLVHITPPDANRTAKEVGEEILHLLRTEYCFNTANLADRLLCDRQWIDTFVRPEVRHIMVTKYFRTYIMDTLPMTASERQLLFHGYYFFSEPSLQDFWKRNGTAERKTYLIDLAKFRDVTCSVYDLQSELLRHQGKPASAKEKALHRKTMQQLLNDKGYELYIRSLGSARVWEPCPLPPLERSLCLTNLAKYQENHDLHSNSVAMQHLVRSGAIRIKIGSRALWVEADRSGMAVPVAVPV